MGRTRICEAIMRCYDDDERDVEAARILKNLPKGATKNSVLRDALLFYYVSINKEEDDQSSQYEELQTIIEQTVRETVKEQMAGMENRIMLEVVKSISELKGSLQGIQIVSPQSYVPVQEERTGSEETEIPADALDFLAKLQPGE